MHHYRFWYCYRHRIKHSSIFGNHTVCTIRRFMRVTKGEHFIGKWINLWMGSERMFQPFVIIQQTKSL
uniref:CCD n=1 Tax=Arundo donax TaxID=35708 RepID=A0A0A9G8S6_ARUDO